MTLQLLFIAVLPIFVLLIFVYFKDRYSKEPIRLLLKAFFFGMLSCIPAIFLESALQSFAPPPSMSLEYSLFTGYGVAGFSEELCKLIMLFLVVWKSKEFDEYFDGIVYATYVSLGFAFVENIMYVFSAEEMSAFSVGIMRAVLSVPGHFLFGVAMGYFFALAKFKPRYKFFNIIKALVVPIFFHGTFDALLLLFTGNSIFYGLLLVAFIIFDIKLWKVGIRRIRSLQELSKEQNDARQFSFNNFKWDV